MAIAKENYSRNANTKGKSATAAEAKIHGANLGWNCHLINPLAWIYNRQYDTCTPYGCSRKFFDGNCYRKDVWNARSSLGCTGKTEAPFLINTENPNPMYTINKDMKRQLFQSLRMIIIALVIPQLIIAQYNEPTYDRMPAPDFQHSYLPRGL